MCCIVAFIFFFFIRNAFELSVSRAIPYQPLCRSIKQKDIRICFNCFIRLCEVYTCSTIWYFLVILRSNCYTDICPHIEGGVVPPIGIQDNWK